MIRAQSEVDPQKRAEKEECRNGRIWLENADAFFDWLDGARSRGVQSKITTLQDEE